MNYLYFQLKLLKEKQKKKMHDIKNIRQNFEEFKKIIKHRNVEDNLDQIILLDKTNRELNQKKEILEHEKKNISKSKDEKLFSKSKEITKNIEQISKEQIQCKIDLDKILSSIPNLPLNDVPLGKDESSNKEIKKLGEIKNFDFTPKSHFEMDSGVILLKEEAFSP